MLCILNHPIEKSTVGKKQIRATTMNYTKRVTDVHSITVFQSPTQCRKDCSKKQRVCATVFQWLKILYIFRSCWQYTRQPCLLEVCFAGFWAEMQIRRSPSTEQNKFWHHFRCIEIIQLENCHLVIKYVPLLLKFLYLV